jgi:DNA-binding HxlR family transcriptional regulator
MNNYALADTGFAIINGVSVPPCGVTTLQALCFFGEPVTITELMEQNEGLFKYSSWHAHLEDLKRKGFVTRSEVTSTRKRKFRVKWEVTAMARRFIELVQDEMN